jgi:glycosyltransferase involved in cell wall biosynthesis
MTKAVIFVAQMYPCGLIRHLAYLGIELYRIFNGTNIAFFLASIYDESHEEDWKLIRQQIPNTSLLQGATFEQVVEGMAALLDRYDRVLIHCGGGYSQIKRIRLLKKKYGKRLSLVVTTHSYQHDSWRRPLMAYFQSWLYRLYVDHVVFQCPYAMRRFVGHGWFVRHAKASVIPLGVETFYNETVDNDSAQQGWAADLADGQTFKFVYLAQFRKGKNHLWLVQILMDILKQYPHARLFFVGGGGNDIQRQLSTYISRNGLDRQVILTGQIPRQDVPWVLRHCDCALVPSQAETFGHCFLEPMMAGIPVIGTRVGVAEYAIQDFGTGLGFTPGSVEGMIQAVRYVLRHPSEAKKMGELASRMVSMLFTHRQVAETHRRLYCHILEEGSSHEGL